MKNLLLFSSVEQPDALKFKKEQALAALKRANHFQLFIFNKKFFKSIGAATNCELLYACEELHRIIEESFKNG